MSPRRFGSEPDADAVAPPEFVYEKLSDHEDKIDALREDLTEGLTEVRRELKDAVTEIKRSNNGETVKVLAGVAVAMITTIGGVFGAAKLERPVPPPVIQRSEIDVRFDACRAMGPGLSREECFQRVLDESRPVR